VRGNLLATGRRLRLAAAPHPEPLPRLRPLPANGARYLVTSLLRLAIAGTNFRNQISARQMQMRPPAAAPSQPQERPPWRAVVRGLLSPGLTRESQGKGGWRLALLVAALFAAHSAVAQQAAPGERQAVPQRPLILQPPAPDFSSPGPNPRPASAARKDGECAPAWPCRLRLFGVIDKTGGVGLKAPVLSW
jgi:hypothetical protein